MPSQPSIPARYAHTIPGNGAGDARPTATQILQDEDVVGKLTDKVFLVTGGTDGLGKESVRNLAKTGAHVWFSARSPEKAEKVKQELLADAELKGAKIDWVKIDLSSFKSVREGAADFLKRSDKLNALLNNAGIANTPYRITDDGNEEQFQTNHLSHFLLVQLLKPLLVKSSTPSYASRVVFVASTAHQFSSVHVGDYNLTKLKAAEDKGEDIGPLLLPMISYGQTKTANIWTANEIERRYGSQGLHGLSLHPGNIPTAGYSNMDPRVAAALEPFLTQEKFIKEFKSVPQGAATQVWAVVSKDLEGAGGIFLENCAESPALPADAPFGSFPGYLAHVKDEQGAKQLWEDSLKLVGVTEA